MREKDFAAMNPSPGREREGPASEGRGRVRDTARSGPGKPRELRQTATLAETKLWAEVRSCRLDGLKFRRQRRVDRYIADFVCVSAKLVVELDGRVHEHQELYDLARTEVIERDGWFVVRFTNEEVLFDLRNVLRKLRDAARPNP
jgi:very-short-patch-repair endonuclease